MPRFGSCLRCMTRRTRALELSRESNSPLLLTTIQICGTQDMESARNPGLSQRRRLAGDFGGLHTAQERRRDAGATRPRVPCSSPYVGLHRAAGIQAFSTNCGLLFDGFGDGGARYFRSPPAKEKSQMPGAALAAAERPQEQQKKDGPLQHAVPVRAQNVLASAQGTSPRAEPKRDGVRSGHRFKYIVKR
jgi:hypothetical protein